MNLSKYELTEDESTALSFSLKMSWPSKIDLIQIQADLESTYCQAENICSVPEILNRLKNKFSWILDSYHRYKPFVPQIVRKLMKCLRNLSKNKDIYVFKPDKGNKLLL